MPKNTIKNTDITGEGSISRGVLYGAYFGDLLERYFGINVPVVLDVNNDP